MSLRRHLAALEAAGAVAVQKEFADRKPRTTIQLSPDGIARFTEYLTALEEVLDQARRAQQTLEKSARARSKTGTVAARQKAEA